MLLVLLDSTDRPASQVYVDLMGHQDPVSQDHQVDLDYQDKMDTLVILVTRVYQVG